jgi:hypothetical protein
MTLKNNYHWGTIKILLVLFLQFSCGQAVKKKPTTDTPKFETTTLTVEISKKNCLAILLAKDGTINRRGTGIIDTADKAFFMGINRDDVFGSLMATISDDLLSYCGQAHGNCDTTKPTYKVTVSFSDDKSIGTGFEYCINGTVDDLPKPIREYIKNAIKLTDPWYQAQKKQINKS